MDKIAALWFCIGVASLGFIFQGELGYILSNNSLMASEEKPQIAEAIYAIPPTPAWSTITVNDTVNTLTDQIDSISSSDNLYIITDGSILINLTNRSGLP